MPLWLIYHPSEVFTDPESKRALAADITSIYTAVGLPRESPKFGYTRTPCSSLSYPLKLAAFYVGVNFIQLPASDMFSGGEPLAGKTPFVRISVSHVARRLPEDEKVYRKFTDSLNRMLKPHLTDKGIDWEFFIAETDRKLWMTSGLYPPESGSEAEKLWVAQNKPVAYEQS
ncbi:hypothetical protein RB601_005419 [Gaeumannomyces tritici]